MQQMWNRLQLLFAHGVSTLVGNDKVQAKVLDGEVLDNLARVEPYGFSYHPHPGSQSYLLFPSGDRSYGVAIMVGDKRYQMDLQSGEVSLHDDIGHNITLMRGGIAVAGGGHDVTVTGAPTVTVNDGDIVVNDGDVVLSDGDVTLKKGDVLLSQGNVVLSNGDVIIGGASVKSLLDSVGGGGSVTPGDLNDAISASELALVATIAQEAAALQAQITTTVDNARTDLNAAIDSASSILEGADLLINNALTTLNQTVDGQVTSITNLNTTVGDHSINLTTLNQTTADYAQSLTSLSLTVGGNSSNLTTLNQTTANQAQSITDLNFTVGNHSQSLITINQTTADLAQSITSLNSTVGDHSGSLTTLNQTTANQALSLISLNSTVGGHSTDISSLAITQNGLVARYGVTINNNGQISGFALNSDAALNGGNPTSAFVIQANKFVLVDPGTAYTDGNSPSAANVPFAVSGGVTYIKEAAIEELSIGGEKIKVGAVSSIDIGDFSSINIPSAAAAVVSGWTGYGSPISTPTPANPLYRMIFLEVEISNNDTTPGVVVVAVKRYNGSVLVGTIICRPDSALGTYNFSGMLFDRVFPTDPPTYSSVYTLEYQLVNGSTNTWSAASLNLTIKISVITLKK